MKKVLKLFSFVMFMTFLFTLNVKASNLTASPTTINVGKTTTLNITVVSGNAYKLDFDTSFLEVDGNHTCGNRSSITTDCTIKLKAKNTESDKTLTITLTELSENDSVSKADITIKANNTTTTTTTNVQQKSNNANLKSIEVLTNNNEKVELTPAFSSSVYEYSAEVPANIKTIVVTPTMEDSKSNVIISDNVNNELVAGENNKITIKVTAEDGTAKLYTLNIKREALSADPGLSYLTIKECKDFKFIEDKYSYNIKVSNDVKTLTINYETKEDGTTVSIDGNDNLENGSKVRVRVTAEDGTARLYTFIILKEDAATANKTSIVADRNPLIIIGLSFVALALIGGIVYVIKK